MLMTIDNLASPAILNPSEFRRVRDFDFGLRMYPSIRLVRPMRAAPLKHLHS
jgi:hypothetical protein